MNLESLIPDASDWRWVVAISVFLVGVHAYRKLSPYFAVTWIGAGALFGALWCADGFEWPAQVRSEVVLLPVSLFYLAAALTKGIVETRDRLRGNHFFHVLMTGVFAGLLGLSLKSSADASGFHLQSFGIDGNLLSSSGMEIGGVPLAVGLGWAVAASAFYGIYKLFDHAGLSKPLQTVVLFVSMPFLVQGVKALSEML